MSQTIYCDKNSRAEMEIHYHPSAIEILLTDRSTKEERTYYFLRYSKVDNRQLCLDL